MKKSFLSADFGALVFGREVLKKFPKAFLVFEVQKAIKNPTECDFWEKGMHEILQSLTAFGRIACFFDRKNVSAKEFCENLDLKKYKYVPQKPHRAEKEARVSSVETQVLHEMANEGLADSVEFRRLARKYIRRAKNANVDTIFWLETIFAEEKTRKIIDHLTGSQIRNVFPVDFLSLDDVKEGAARSLEIHTGDDASFTHKRAEAILRTKIGKEDVKS